MLVLQSSTADLAALEWASGHLGCLQLGYWVVNHLVVYGHQSGLQQFIWDGKDSTGHQQSMACFGILHRVVYKAGPPSLQAGRFADPWDP